MTAVERREWLEARRRSIGSSDVAALVGLAPPSWGSPWSVWASKVGLLPVDRDPHDDDRYEFGHEMEAVLARMFERRTGLVVAGEQTHVVHPEHPWASTTLDGYTYDRPIESGIELTTLAGKIIKRYVDDVPAVGTWEAKTDGESWDWDVDGIPLVYQCQAQWSLFVTGLHVVHFAVEHHRFGGRRLGVYQLERNDEDIALLVERADRFWHDHVKLHIPPPVDATPATSDALAAAWPNPDREPPVDLTEHVGLIEEWRRKKAFLNTVKHTVQVCANELRALLGDRTDGYVNGELAVSWRKSKDSTEFDVHALAADHPDLFEKYSRPKPGSRRLYDHTPKKEHP